MSAQTLPQSVVKVRWKSAALPVEHGSWSFLLEPIVLGLLVAPSLGGFGIAILTIGAFLAHHPFKLALSDFKRNQFFPRTKVALNFILAFGAVTLSGSVIALMNSSAFAFFTLLPALPLALLQIFFDSTKRSRAVLAELSGAVALGSSVAAIALAAGWPLIESMALWLALTCRAMPSILYVRTKFRSARTGESLLLPLIAHLLGLSLIAFLVWLGLLPKLALLAFFLLLLRAIYGLLPQQTKARAVTVGITEIIFGSLTISSLAIGIRFSL